LQCGAVVRGGYGWHGGDQGHGLRGVCAGQVCGGRRGLCQLRGRKMDGRCGYHMHQLRCRAFVDAGWGFGCDIGSCVHAVRRRKIRGRGSCCGCAGDHRVCPMRGRKMGGQGNGDCVRKLQCRAFVSGGHGWHDGDQGHGLHIVRGGHVFRQCRHGVSELRCRQVAGFNCGGHRRKENDASGVGVRGDYSVHIWHGPARWGCLQWRLDYGGRGLRSLCRGPLPVVGDGDQVRSHDLCGWFCQ